jgi:quinoprotein dehydrogenase-associated probable ABC transporter substrate-binding protein
MLVALLWWPPQASAQAQRLLAVCADPSNLPFSNDKLEGFENKIASLIAEELQATLRYTWSEQRRSFLRRTLLAHRCEVVMGVPPGLPGVEVTRPYYVSSYVFVSAHDRNLHLDGFDDPALRDLKIGVEAINVEGANTPPVNAVARRGLAGHVVGFSGADTEESESRAAKMIEAVANHEIDVAILWGPFGGYFAKRHAGRLVVTPIASDPQQPTLPFSFPISLGVRKGDVRLQAELQGVLDRRQADIRAILKEYSVPLVLTPVATAPGDGPAPK